MDILKPVLLLSFLTCLFTLAGGFIGIWYSAKLRSFMAFTAGMLLGVCFFDILPEACGIDGNHTPMFVAVVAGFLLFHVLEKTIVIHHAHEADYADHRHPAVGLFGASGLVFHSCLDGVGIGLGFHVSPAIGTLVALAVIAHDFSDGLNTVTLMLAHRNSKPKAAGLLVADAVAPILGALSTFVFPIPQSLLSLYLGFFAGFLLYISAGDLLPEAHSKDPSLTKVGLTILGAAFIFLVTRFV